jgi:type III secretion protein R
MNSPFIRRKLPAFAVFASVVLASSLAHAQRAHAQATQAVRIDDVLGKPIALVVALAIASVVPFVFMGMTAFVKISTTLQIVKSAIGAQSVPSNTVVMALATALTLIAMAPVGETILQRTKPLIGSATDDTTMLIDKGIDAVRDPMRDFLKANSSEKERVRFLKVAKKARSPAEAARVAADDLTVLVPAFVVTELTEAFAIGFLIYLPFIVIDMVVASVLMSMGMMMLPPAMISMPFKIMVFVLMGGWRIIVENLLVTFV